MRILNERPPDWIWDACRKQFGDVVHQAVFTYGEALFNPGKADIPTHLMKHEETHTRQQLAMGADDWWKKYLADPEFRLDQEAEAYGNQYKYIYGNKKNGWARAEWLTKLAHDLSSELYGRMISMEEAEKLILERSQIHGT